MLYGLNLLTHTLSQGCKDVKNEQSCQYFVTIQGPKGFEIWANLHHARQDKDLRLIS